MRRRDREVSELEGIRQILDRSKVIHIGMHDGDDIYILPMNYGYTLEDGKLTFYMHGGLKGKKLDLIRANAKVAFELDCDHYLVEGKVPCQYGYGYASVMGKGTASIIEDGQEKMEAMSIFMKCLTDKEFEFNERLVSIVTVIKLTADEFTGKRRPVGINTEHHEE